MDSLEVKKLEEKYWAGQTSLEEERLLKTMASAGDTSLSNEIKALFESTDSASDLELGADFDEAFWRRVEAPSTKKPVILYFASALKYAAAAVLLLGLTAVVWNLLSTKESINSDTPVQVSATDTYEDPEKAFEEAKKALLLASEKFNKGAKPMGEIKRFHNTQMSITGSSNNNETDN